MSPQGPMKVRTAKKIEKPYEGGTPELSLSADRLEWVEAWGMASKSMAHVYRPTTVDGIRQVFDLARRSGRTIAAMGGANSYGDAFQNCEEIVLDLSRMTRILEWDPGSGIIALEPGVRLCDLWRYAISDGWWPPVVSGTMFTTMGGCLGMNIHGKNAWRVGPFGEHVLAFEVLLPNGTIKRVTRESDSTFFHAAIAGMGMLGIFTRIELKMKRVYSGMLEVTAKRAANVREQLDLFEEHADQSDYMVGWADCFPKGAKQVGRGELHFARHLAPDEDKMPAQTLRVCNQELPDTIMGVLPKSILHKLIAPLVNDFGMRMINMAKYCAQYKPGAEKPYRQSHAGFAFLLDYVPNWKAGYRPGGLIQYQSFVPRKAAARVFTEQLLLSQKRGIVPYLGVTKKHRPDNFLISHGLDGYSLALDYRVTAANKKALWRLCHEMDELVLDAGGRFYFAKDCTMRPGTQDRYISAENLSTFKRLKNEYDPEGLISSNLYRRVFGLPSTPDTENASLRTGISHRRVG